MVDIRVPDTMQILKNTTTLFLKAPIQSAELKASLSEVYANQRIK